MTDICSKADRVVIWLGPAARSTSLAFDMMMELASKIKVDWATFTMTNVSSELWEQHWANAYGTLPYTKQARQSVTDLLERKWFNRLWIWVSPSLFSHRLYLLCSKHGLALLTPLCNSRGIPCESLRSSHVRP